MANVPEEIIPGSASQFMGNGISGSGSSVTTNRVNGFVPGVTTNGVERSIPRVMVNGVVANGAGGSAAQVMNDGVSRSVFEVVVNGVSRSVARVEANAIIANDVGGSAAHGMTNGASGSVSEVGVNGVSRLVSQVQADGVIANGVGGSFDLGMSNGVSGSVSSVPQVDKDHLLRYFNQEVREDIARFWERMQLEDVEKGTRTLLMMRETESISYASVGPNGKLIYNSIINGPYVRRMIPEPGDADREELVRVQQIDGKFRIGIQEKKDKLFNEWERFTSTDGESIESYYHHFSKTKGLNTADYTQLYDFLKYNQKKVDDLRAERLAKTHDPLALMQITQPGINMGQDRQMQMVGGNGGNQFRQYAGQNVRNQNGYNVVQNVENQVVQNAVQNPGVQNVGNQNGGLGHLPRNCTVRLRRRDAAYLQTQLLIAQKEEAGI
ncbi:hypothetical protein Tco_0978033 [Tanacetum coccineum]|uniref:Uncharacterized protein n=1 Tax=Tanacetum coccineum TaxID=301880 RepID=A0ABQ5ELS6_9ASTR